MLILFTDFGVRGPYVGEMKIVIESLVPGLPVIDLMHDAPRFNPRASAYLLAAMLEDLPGKCVVCGVVDPGVGSDRLPVVYRCDQRWFVGPGNGLFEIAARRSRNCDRWQITEAYDPPSASFHGRDIFAPIAARLAVGDTVEMVGLESEAAVEWPDDLTEVIYIDDFGNAMTGIRAERVEVETSLAINGRPLFKARTFSDLPPGVPFWYENSLGLVEIAVNQGNATSLLGLEIGTPVAGF
ncbi:MAG: SAM-dependent chlorinase/fluorinase [Xanthomonadales bacterium]|nr:SAM-dependent chlorinase/fluorinase [Xanthomonadales bacterium]